MQDYKGDDGGPGLGDILQSALDQRQQQLAAERAKESYSNRCERIIHDRLERLRDDESLEELVSAMETVFNPAQVTRILRDRITRPQVVQARLQPGDEDYIFKDRQYRIAILNPEASCKKINAIKELREVLSNHDGSRLGLKEAKDFVEGNIFWATAEEAADISVNFHRFNYKLVEA